MNVCVPMHHVSGWPAACAVLLSEKSLDSPGCVNAQVCVFIYTYVRTCVYIKIKCLCEHLCTYIIKCVCVCVCVCVYMHVCTYVAVSVCVAVCVVTSQGTY